MEDYTCNRENMTKLVEALESGEYRQTSGTLRRTDDTFCCLGVACDLAAKEGVGSWTRVGSPHYRFIDNDTTVYNKAESALTDGVSTWLGLALDPEGETFGDIVLPALDGDTNSAISMNDGLGASFREIAAKIRETYLN